MAGSSSASKSSQAQKNGYDQNKCRQVSDKIAVCQPIDQLSDESPHLSCVLNCLGLEITRTRQ